MARLSPKKKAQKPKTRKPKAIPWRVKYGAHTKAIRPCITPFNEPEHAVSYPVKPILWTLAEANERVLDIYKEN